MLERERDLSPSFSHFSIEAGLKGIAPLILNSYELLRLYVVSLFTFQIANHD